MSILSQINLDNVPQHIAIIMDGNGRWAKKQGEQRLYGHSIGVDSVKNTVKAAQKIGVKYLTFFTFSTENWNRPKEEIDGLMNLLVQSIANEVDEMNENGVRIMSIGDNSQLPIDAQNEINAAMESTSKNEDITMVLALNYSSRWEITNAVKLISQDIKTDKIKNEEINVDLISSYLTTNKIPDPELLIRTSGEHRISNFLLWQIAYTEFHFTEVLWPDFNADDLYKAVLDYQSRERRFGMITEQLK
jgi:undecaprenyl diphosphate synthase